MWIDALLGGRCPGCRGAGPAPCLGCRRALCPVGLVDPLPDGLDACLALYAYEGVGRELVLGLKYRNQRDTVPWFGRALAAQARAVLHAGDVPRVATWVPASPAHRRQRGYDQGALLARALARELRIEAREVMERGSGPAQTGADRARRLQGPPLRSRVPVIEPVLVVDDVTTTGGSLAAAARCVRAAGAPAVVGLTVAFTPHPAGR